MNGDVGLPDLGRRITAARLRRGYSQGTVARLSGVAPSYLSRIENGKIQPTFRMVLRILRALRVELSEIVEPGSLTRHAKGPCPVSAHGRCLLELVRSEADLSREQADESYTPRQVRLLRRLARWMRTVRDDRLRAMEILLEDWQRGGAGPPS
ncbi:MAG: helix-turn-helix transcriptional regulator [Gemmatimonadota bacterium]|jgi:transcriptional regulator with XRE-family HTH domain